MGKPDVPIGECIVDLQGECPQCGHEHDDKRSSENRDFENGVCYNYVCEKCGAEFHEFWALAYANTTLDEAGEKEPT